MLCINPEQERATALVPRGRALVPWLALRDKKQIQLAKTKTKKDCRLQGGSLALGLQVAGCAWG